MIDSPLRVRLVQNVGELPEKEWQQLVCGKPALRLELLRAIAAHARRPLLLQIFLLEDPQGLAAAAICELVARGSTHNSLDELLLGRWARAVRAFGISTQPAFVFHTPFMRQSPLVVRSADTATQNRWLECLLDGIESHAAGLKAGIAFIGMTDDDESLATALRARQYLQSGFETTASLEVTWSDFDSYVECLRRRSKNAAQNARTERSRSRKNGIVIRQVEATQENALLLYQLTRDHFWHKNRREPLYGLGFMPQLAMTLGQDLLIFEAIRGDRRLAMLAVVRSEDVGLVAWIGIEQQNRQNDFTYANIAFYHLADLAPALGLRTLIYGRAAQDAKAKRGCQLLLCYLFYRPRQRVARLLAAPLLALYRLRKPAVVNEPLAAGYARQTACSDA